MSYEDAITEYKSSFGKLRSSLFFSSGNNYKRMFLYLKCGSPKKVNQTFTATYIPVRVDTFQKSQITFKIKKKEGSIAFNFKNFPIYFKHQKYAPFPEQNASLIQNYTNDNTRLLAVKMLTEETELINKKKWFLENSAARFDDFYSEIQLKFVKDSIERFRIDEIKTKPYDYRVIFQTERGWYIQFENGLTYALPNNREKKTFDVNSDLKFTKAFDEILNTIFIRFNQALNNTNPKKNYESFFSSNDVNFYESVTQNENGQSDKEFSSIEEIFTNESFKEIFGNEFECVVTFEKNKYAYNVLKNNNRYTFNQDS